MALGFQGFLGFLEALEPALRQELPGKNRKEPTQTETGRQTVRDRQTDRRKKTA